ncbi:hypothetical protein [Thermostilla marina]
MADSLSSGDNSASPSIIFAIPSDSEAVSPAGEADCSVADAESPSPNWSVVDALLHPPVTRTTEIPKTTSNEIRYLMSFLSLSSELPKPMTDSFDARVGRFLAQNFENSAKRGDLPKQRACRRFGSKAIIRRGSFLSTPNLHCSLVRQHNSGFFQNKKKYGSYAI